MKSTDKFEDKVKKIDSNNFHTGNHASNPHV